MKVKVEMECTPEEARTFLGLPNVAPINDHLVQEVKRRMDENMTRLQPEELFKTWMSFGGMAQDQFRKLMSQATMTGKTGLGSNTREER